MKYATILLGGVFLLAAGCGSDEEGDGPGAALAESGPTLCEDGLDNDGDGATDCDDAECFSHCGAIGYMLGTEDEWHRKANRGEVVDPGDYVADEPEADSFALVAGGAAAPLVVSEDDHEGVVRAAHDLQTDLERVTSVEPELSQDPSEYPAREAVLIGTIGKSPLIDSLIQAEKLDVTGIEGKWETFVITAVDAPLEGLERALVIAGSDQRGTIFGIYDLSAQIGVSPWHFWADVPPQRSDELHVLAGRHSQGEPAVKYRGIFINDENPALDLWHRQYFAEEGYPFKSAFYEKVYEVMLRLKANYLWPAVWGRAFAEDDPRNHAVAKRYGIVMGTSHEAPMMRGIEEWNRHAQEPDASGEGGRDPYGGNGEWSYRTNAAAIEAYWREGIERMVDEDFEGVVTLGMRNKGDYALAPEDGIALMDEFVAAQREIIADVTGEHPAATPQVWSLYKEIQGWWEEGLRVPTDVTVVLADDNWGNLRMLPDPAEPERIGGYGLYYHFDYVGGPRNYKWVDTNLLPNVWEQLHLAYSYGVDRLWVVNVGDLKGNELPTQFFLDFAWNPERWPVERLTEWEEQYAAQQFGSSRAEAIADVLHRYALLQSDRKPELLNRKGRSEGSPFSLTNYTEMERVVAQWLDLADDAEAIGSELSEEYQDTYYQLVLYPVKASALMYELRLAGFENLLYESQGRAATDDMAALAEERFAESQALADYYNQELSDGKWEGFQTQPYLGYKGWQQPEDDAGNPLADSIHPALVSLDVPPGVEMGVAIDGSEDYWPSDASGEARLPTFSPYQTQPAQYIEVFRRAAEPFDFAITTSPAVDWLQITPSEGTLDAATPELRAVVAVTDWGDVPAGATELTLTVTNLTDGTSVDIAAVVENPEASPADGAYVESNGYVSMEAAKYSRSVEVADIAWAPIPDIGRTGSGMTPMPVTTARQEPGEGSPRLEYDVHLFTSGTITVWTYLSPRQNVLPTDGLTFAISIDDGDPKLVNVTEILQPFAPPPDKASWEIGVADNVHRVSTEFELGEAGAHVIKIWMVDPTLILQKLVVDTGGLLESYLGPPESYVAGSGD